MDGLFMENGKKEPEYIAEEKEAVQYEYKGYQIRVHFSGERTLAQCLKALAEREAAEAMREN